jgi:hypothetical protein
MASVAALAEKLPAPSVAAAQRADTNCTNLHELNPEQFVVIRAIRVFIGRAFTPFATPR